MLVKLLFHLIVAVILCSSQLTPQTEDEWWHGFGDWDTPASLQSNPFYQTQQYLQNQMDLFGFAQHVGKINRGQIFNPELNSPMNHAYGYQNDFNDEDFTSGAFRNPSKGQMIRATQAHVDRGLAKAVGEIAVMPVGTNVQPDGTILVQTSTHQKNPCNPNPCSKYKMSQCDVINDVTAKCSQHGNYELTLRWTTDYHDMYFTIDPAFHDGTECAEYDFLYDDYDSDGDDLDGISGCGVIIGPDTVVDNSGGVYVAEQNALFTQLDDGTKYQDYTYQIIATKSSYNPSLSDGELVISYEGEVKHIVKIPQYDGADNVNNAGRANYFFGCFRPYAGGYYLDTNGAGFYDDADVIIGDLKVLDNGLCNALRMWTGSVGYNHNDDQAGSAE